MKTQRLFACAIGAGALVACASTATTSSTDSPTSSQDASSTSDAAATPDGGNSSSGSNGGTDASSTDSSADAATAYQPWTIGGGWDLKKSSVDGSYYYYFGIAGEPTTMPEDQAVAVEEVTADFGNGHVLSWAPEANQQPCRFGFNPPIVDIAMGPSDTKDTPAFLTNWCDAGGRTTPTTGTVPPLRDKFRGSIGLTIRGRTTKGSYVLVGTLPYQGL